MQACDRAIGFSGWPLRGVVIAALLRSLLAKLIGPKLRGAVASRISPPTIHCPATINQFTVLIVKSRICSESEARDAAESFAADCGNAKSAANVELFCEFLVATNRLTEWQCSNLRMGRWKGFYLDHYLLLDHVAKDSESSSYKARDTRDGKLVVLAITPVNRTNGQIEYRVYPYL